METRVQYSEQPINTSDSPRILKQLHSWTSFEKRLSFTIDSLRCGHNKSNIYIGDTEEDFERPRTARYFALEMPL